MTTRQATANGLAQDAVSLRHVLGEGFISNGPLASVTVALAAAAAFGAGALPLTVLLGALIALTWINTPYQFSAYINSAGGIFSFIRSTLGDRWGFAGSLGYYFYYVLLVPGNALVLTGLFTWLGGDLGYTVPSWLWVAVVAVTSIPPFLLAYFKITPSLTYGIFTAAIEAIVVVGVAIALIIHAGAHNTGKVFTSPHLALNGWHGVIVGMAVASTALGGPDAVVFLGEESRSARSTIRKALLITQFSVIALYLLYSYAATVAWGPEHMGTFATSPAPGLVLVQSISGKGLVVIVALLVLNSSIGVNLAINITASRMLFDHSRVGLLPASFRKTHPRLLTPAVALTITFLIEVVAAVVARSVWGAIDGFLVCLVGATAGGIFSFVITDVALIALGRREKLKRVVWMVVVPLLSIALLGLSIYGNFFPITFPSTIGPIFVLACMAAGFVYAAVITRDRRRVALPTEPVQLASLDAAELVANRLEAEESSRSGAR
jgi:amino acid transporter